MSGGNAEAYVRAMELLTLTTQDEDKIFTDILNELDNPLAVLVALTTMFDGYMGFIEYVTEGEIPKDKSVQMVATQIEHIIFGTEGSQQ